MTNITPSNEQNQAIKAISNWYHNGSKPFFYLAGYAGSGKTSIAKPIVHGCGIDPDDTSEVLYAAYTNKAAMVLGRKGLNASTIHNLMYILKEVQGKGKERKLVFGLDPASRIRNLKLLVLDEPTSALDHNNREAFIELLLEQANQAGSTLIFVSHDPTLEKLFTRTIDLKTVNQAKVVV